jgi:hypothetical protein
MNEDPILSREEAAAIRRILQEAARAEGYGAPDYVEKRLLGAMRRRRMMRVARLTLTGAVAAALMAGLWLRTPPEGAPAPVAEKVEPPAAEQVETASAGPPPPVERRRTRRPARAKAVAQPPAAFIPVGAWQAMEPMERGSIVRVRLPLSAMQGLGIPVSGERWSESVPAEVVLGEDGTMRAVRIMNTRQ